MSNMIKRSIQILLILLSCLCTIFRLSSPATFILKLDSLSLDFIHVIHQTLHWFYDHKATFNLTLQSDTLTFILSQTQPDSWFYIVLGTRCRKSLLYQLLMTLHSMNIYVIIVSYCALKQNIHHHCCSLSLLMHSWVKNMFKLKLRIVMVGMKRVSKWKFWNWVQITYINDFMKMIFNNKTHTVITTLYCINIQKFCKLQHLNILMVHLTTTLPPSMYDWFQPMYDSMKNQKMLCAYSQCLNIWYKVWILKDVITEKVFIQIMTWKILQNQIEWLCSWMFIYTQFKKVTYELMNELNILMRMLSSATQYHKNLLMNQCDQMFWNWQNGKVLFMIVISALSVSIDILNLWWVYHVNCIYSLINFIQQSRHAEQNKKRVTFCTLLLSVSLQTWWCEDKFRLIFWCNVINIKVQNDFLDNINHCYQIEMFHYLNS